MEKEGLTVKSSRINKMAPYDMEITNGVNILKIEIETYRKESWVNSIADVEQSWNRGFSIPSRRIKDGVPKSRILIKQNHSSTSFIAIDLQYVADHYQPVQRESYIARSNKKDGDPDNNRFYEIPWKVVKGYPNYVIYDDFENLVKFIKARL